MTTFHCHAGDHDIEVESLPEKRWLPEGWRAVSRLDLEMNEWQLACEEHDPDRLSETTVQRIGEVIENWSPGTSAHRLLSTIAAILADYEDGETVPPPQPVVGGDTWESWRSDPAVPTPAELEHYSSNHADCPPSVCPVARARWSTDLREMRAVPVVTIHDRVPVRSFTEVVEGARDIHGQPMRLVESLVEREQTIAEYLLRAAAVRGEELRSSTYAVMRDAGMEVWSDGAS